MGREATDKELSGGIICDGLGSSFAALFGVLPNTSFSQNVGLVAMTKIVNRFALACGAVFLILCGLLPKTGSRGVHHAPVRAGRRSGHHVLFHRDERHPADHQRAHDPPGP